MPHMFRGQIRTRVQRRKKWSQDATRNPIVLEDQFGRKYSASTEQKSGYPTGLISPLFKAPWYAPQKYFVINPDNISEMYIDLGGMFADAKAANAAYHRRAVRVCSKKGWPAPIRGEYSEDVIESLGEPPAPVQPIVACYQGNRYLLGLCDGCKKGSNECVCAGGYRAPKPDPRLLPFISRRREELEEVVEGLDFSEASRQKALRDSGLKEVQVGGRRQLRDIEDEELEGMDFSEAPESAADPATEQQLGAPPIGAPADVSDDAPEGGDSVEEAQTRALEHMGDGGDDLEKDLAEIEEEVDAGAQGGRTVPPAKAAVAARQVPRRETQSATRRNQGAHRSRVGGPGGKRSQREDAQGQMTSLRAKGDKRASLADGAKPVVGSAVHEDL